MGVYLTEFGIQSFPDRLLGVSLARQAEFIAISEHIAYRNRRVRSFSQYLWRDDEPRTLMGSARSATPASSPACAVPTAGRSRHSPGSGFHWSPRGAAARRPCGGSCGPPQARRV